MSTRLSTLSPAKPSPVAQSNHSSSTKAEVMMKSVYSVDQQVKFLHLQAEVDTLLLRLQTLKQKNSKTPSTSSSHLN